MRWSSPTHVFFFSKDKDATSEWTDEYAGELLQRMNENNDEGILWNGRKSSMKLKRKWTNSSKTSLAAWASASATGAQRELHSHAVASNGAVHQP